MAREVKTNPDASFTFSIANSLPFDEDANEHVATLVSGDFFGERALLCYDDGARGRRCATFRAAENTLFQEGGESESKVSRAGRAVSLGGGPPNSGVVCLSLPGDDFLGMMADIQQAEGLQGMHMLLPSYSDNIFSVKRLTEYMTAFRRMMVHYKLPRKDSFLKAVSRLYKTGPGTTRASRMTLYSEDDGSGEVGSNEDEEDEEENQWAAAQEVAAIFGDDVDRVLTKEELQKLVPSKPNKDDENAYSSVQEADEISRALRIEAQSSKVKVPSSPSASVTVPSSTTTSSSSAPSSHMAFFSDRHRNFLHTVLQKRIKGEASIRSDILAVNRLTLIELQRHNEVVHRMSRWKERNIINPEERAKKLRRFVTFRQIMSTYTPELSVDDCIHRMLGLIRQ